MKLRVLLVHNRYRQRAGEDLSFAAERDLLARDERVELSEHVVDSREIDDYTPLRKASVPFRMSWSRATAAALGHRLSGKTFDVVHFHNTFPLISPSGYRVCRDAGARVVQSVRNFRQLCANGVFFRDGHVCEDCVGRVPQWPGVVHRCYHGSAAQSAAVVAMQTVHSIRGTWRREVDRFVVPTRFVRDKLAAGGLPGETIWVKPDVVAPPPSPPDAPRGHAVFVGRLTYEKGIFTLLRAWRDVHGIPLVVAGGGPEEERARAEAGSLGLEELVTFLGETSHAAAIDAIARARFVVIPSLSYETFGRTAVEAFACGTPVLASRIGGLVETVVDGETGLLFRAGDADDLATKARRLWSEFPALSPKARARYASTYEPHVVHDQLIALYRDLRS